MYNRLYKYLSDNNYLYEKQLGFQAARVLRSDSANKSNITGF